MIKITYLLLLCLVGLLGLPNMAQSAGFVLRAEEVETAIADALAKAGAANHPKALITNNRKQILYQTDKSTTEQANLEQQIEVEINKLTHDVQNKTWVANLLLLQNNNVISAQALSGKYEEQKAIPVLRESFNNGKIIMQQDLDVRYVPEYKVPRGTITDANLIIGLTPARLISRDRPIREQELVKPTMIAKGTTVQMLFQTNSIDITTIGEALDDGAIGDFIRVRNNDSKNIVKAKIISNNQVMVGTL